MPLFTDLRSDYPLNLTLLERPYACFEAVLSGWTPLGSRDHSSAHWLQLLVSFAAPCRSCFRRSSLLRHELSPLPFG